MNIEKSAAKLSRNPLGIIALFILMIYGFATLLFGLVGDVFTNGQRWCFVVFLVAFPVVVLGIFTYLVVNHHQKLYAPGDFKNEENFIGYGSQDDKNEQYDNDTDKLKNEENNKQARDELIKQRREEREKVHRIENLVYDYYEKNYHYGIDRDIYYKINERKILFDGVIDKNDTLTLLTTKYLPNNNVPNFLLYMYVMNAIKVIGFLSGNGKYSNYKFKFLLTFVVDSNDISEISDITKRIKNQIDIDLINIDIKVLNMHQLEESL